MRKTVMWGLAALMAVIGFVGSPAQARDPGLKPLDGGAAIEGRRYRRPPPRRGGYYGPRYGYGWGGPRYRPYRSYHRYYAPPRVVYAPPPVVYYGGVSCY